MRVKVWSLKLTYPGRIRPKLEDALIQFIGKQFFVGITYDHVSSSKELNTLQFDFKTPEEASKPRSKAKKMLKRKLVSELKFESETIRLLGLPKGRWTPKSIDKYWKKGDPVP